MFSCQHDFELQQHKFASQTHMAAMHGAALPHKESLRLPTNTRQALLPTLKRRNWGAVCVQNTVHGPALSAGSASTWRGLPSSVSSVAW